MSMPHEDTRTDETALGTEPTRKRPKPGERRVQILQALAAMLEQPGSERITTAALAHQLEVSEAALYRHFASKAQMFEALIDFIEQSIFGFVGQLEQREPDAIERRAPVRRLAVAIDRPGHGRRQQAERDVDVEDPFPAQVVGDPAAQQRPADRREQHRHRPDAQRPPGPLGRVAAEQQGLRQRHHRPGHQPLQHPEGDQPLHRRGERAQPRGGREQQRAGDEQAHLPETRRQPAGERHPGGPPAGQPAARDLRLTTRAITEATPAGQKVQPAFFFAWRARPPQPPGNGTNNSSLSPSPRCRNWSSR
jgi:AcrR family transcriptional regulator